MALGLFNTSKIDMEVCSKGDCGTEDSSYYYYDWKKLLNKYPEYAKHDYVWTKELEEYTPKEIRDLDISKLNFIYNSNLSFKKEVQQNIKNIRTYAIILLGYLMTVTLTAIGFLLKDNTLIISGLLEYAALSLMLSYFVLVFFVASLFYDKNTTYVHFASEEYMTKNMFKYDEKLLKIYDIRNTQLTGTHNYFIAKHMRRNLDCYISMALIIPVIIIVAIIAWSFFSWITCHYACHI